MEFILPALINAKVGLITCSFILPIPVHAYEFRIFEKIEDRSGRWWKDDYFIMPFICINNPDDDEGSSLLFPIHEELTKSDLQTAFPNVTSLRYKNSDNGQIHHILCRNGIFIKPEGGWEVEGRIYSVISEATASGSRLSLFDTYRRQLGNRHKKPSSSSDNLGHRKPEKENANSVMIHVGIGCFKRGRFSKISAHNLSGIGGQVVVGPFPKTTNTIEAIKSAAFEKFHCLNRSFRKTYNKSDKLCLVYNDGTIVDKLPDKSGEFSLESYRNFIDPKLKFERLRFYLCEKAQVDLYNDSDSIEIITDSSSSSEDLPELTFPRQNEQEHESADDTIPLTIEVSFFYKDGIIYKESFPNNTTISVLLAYLHDERNLGLVDEGETVTLKFGQRALGVDERLIEINNAHDVQLDVEINRTSFLEDDEQVDTAVSTPIPADLNGETLIADAIVKKTVEEMAARSEPEQIFRCFRNNFLQGRSLDVEDASTVPSGETSCIFIGRNNILTDMISEITALGNLRYPLEVNFYGEESEDFGGPRKEFFRLAIAAIKESLLKEDGTLFINEDLIAKKAYYAAGIVLGLSAIQGGPCSSIVTRNISSIRPQTEASEQFYKGLQHVGIQQLLKDKPTMRHLFEEERAALTVQKLVQMLRPIFSEEGTSKRTKEEYAYSLFIRYVRNVAGRQPGISMEKILSFVTGSEEEPILGFSIEPSITFADLPGYLPTATTCVNMLYLPLPPTTVLEEDMFYKFSMAFASEYFGMR